MKVVINTCYGGFGLSQAAMLAMKNEGCALVGECSDGRLHYDRYGDGARHDPILVRVVERMGIEANNRFANLKVVEIPDGVEYVVEEYDGWEHIAEKHRTWQ